MLYLAFIGQNASTGTPHPLTGGMNMYGDLANFSTKSDRDLFVAEYYDINNPSVFVEKTNKQDAKSKYCAGMSQYFYEQYIDEVECRTDERIAV